MLQGAPRRTTSKSVRTQPDPVDFSRLPSKFLYLSTPSNPVTKPKFKSCQEPIEFGYDVVYVDDKPLPSYVCAPRSIWPTKFGSVAVPVAVLVKREADMDKQALRSVQ